MLYTILFIILIILIIVLGFKFIKNVIKTIVLSLILTLLVLAILGFFLYSDMNALESEELKWLVLFQDEGKLVYGFTAQGFEFSQRDILQEDQLETLQGYYDESYYAGMLGGNDNLVIFERKKFAAANNEELPDELTDAFEAQGISYIYPDLKKGSTIMYPENMFFKVLRYMPSFVVGKIQKSNKEDIS